ncbi:MAG: hypothetical protein MUF69_01375 [Desulfobacterota bacterium]|jgi:hypothetical protein|nr:hypothetical protein [Thermodesulfobacteriota bacterium]
MKRDPLIPCLVALAIAILGASEVQAFSSATHIYITDRVYPRYAWSLDLAYGSIAPDIDLYLADPTKWETAYEDTHQTYSDLTPYACVLTQKLFAVGWRSHGEICGADLYAHFVDPLDEGGTGYVPAMVTALNEFLAAHGQSPLPDLMAHIAIEMAVDLLLQNNVDQSLGDKLLKATLYRSWLDRNLLTRVLVLDDHRTDFLTLAMGELRFRTIIKRYAEALALPYPQNIDAVAALGAEMSEALFGFPATKEELIAIFGAAMAVCADTYLQAVTNTIHFIATDHACHAPGGGPYRKKNPDKH